MTNDYKALLNERNNLIVRIDQQSKIIEQIKSNLVDEVNSYQELQNRMENGEKAIDICDQPEIFTGRNEYAEGLLNLIEKWEEE